MSKQVSIERCHACGQNMRFELDLDLNGNHVLDCPKCGHEHCRVVENGRVTGDRWDNRNGLATYYVTVSATASSDYSGSTWTYAMWANSTSGTW